MIIIVSGLPRSGTSLMMQMLEAAGLDLATDGDRVPDADNPKGYFELEAVKKIRRDDSFLEDLSGKAVKIVAPLLRFLPSNHDYRILFMERELDEVLASQAAMLIRRGECGTVATDQALRTAYQRQGEKVRPWLAAQRNISTLFVGHRRAIEDPLGVAEAVLEFLERYESDAGRNGESTSLNSRRAAMARVVEPSLHRHS